MKQGDIIRTRNGVKWVVAVSDKCKKSKYVKDKSDMYRCVLVSIQEPYKKYPHVPIGTVFNCLISPKHKSINGSFFYTKISFTKPQGLR